MRIFMIVLYLLLILVGVSFAALNAGPVQVNFYISKVTMPISVLMTVSLGVGLLIGVILFLLRYWRLKMDYVKIKNQLKLSEKEVKNLRDIPLKNQH